jgi:hypothetical protein
MIFRAGRRIAAPLPFWLVAIPDLIFQMDFVANRRAQRVGFCLLLSSHFGRNGQSC